MRAKQVLDWYDRNRRHFAWRAAPGVKPNPYHVWLSEVMLQQTNTTTVTPYFQNFIRMWPTVQDLAQAELDEILHAWQGLGYYSRARSLYKAAQILSGQFPKTQEELLKIPGIGPYTSAAIAAIAFNLPSKPVDGNIARIYARLYEIQEIKPRLYETVQEKLASDVSPSRNGDFIQALMDIGATICLPKSPRCLLCPLQSSCKAFKSNTQSNYPLKVAKKALPRLLGNVYWIENKKGQIWIQKRPDRGLLAGLYEFPSSPWEPEAITPAITLPFEVEIQHTGNQVQHVFTHFHLTLNVILGKTGQDVLDGTWTEVEKLHTYAFPSLMKKVMRVALKL